MKSLVLFCAHHIMEKNMINNISYEVVLLIGLKDLIGYDQAHLGVLESSQNYMCVLELHPQHQKQCRFVDNQF